MTACNNLLANIYTGYDRTQNDSVNPYVLPVRCQKLMADNFNSYFIGGIRVPTDVFLIKKYLKYHRKLFNLVLPIIKLDVPLLFQAFI